MLARLAIIASLMLSGFRASSSAVEEAGGSDAVQGAALDLVRKAERQERASYGIPPHRSQEWRRRHARQVQHHPANPRRRR